MNDYNDFADSVCNYSGNSCDRNRYLDGAYDIFTPLLLPVSL